MKKSGIYILAILSILDTKFQNQRTQRGAEMLFMNKGNTDFIGVIRLDVTNLS